MRRKLIELLIIWILFLLQTTVFKFLQIASTSPNLLLILTVSMGFMEGRREGIFTGFISGMLIDLFYGTIFGYYALIYMTIGYACGHLCDIFFNEDIKVPLILVTVSDFLYGCVVYMTRFFLRGRVHFGGYLTSVILPEIVYTVILTLILYRILYLIDVRLASHEKGSARNLWLKG